MIPSGDVITGRQYLLQLTWPNTATNNPSPYVTELHDRDAPGVD